MRPCCGYGVTERIGKGGKKIMKYVNMFNRGVSRVQEYLADALGLSLRQCERLIAEMKRKNLIRRTGSNKFGFWKIV